MKHDYFHFREVFPDDLNIQHKIAPTTEKTNFHLHSHMELIYTISDNLVFVSERRVQRLPAHSILLLNSMSLHYIDYLENGTPCDRYVLYFNPDLMLSLNTPEINLLDSFLRQRDDGFILSPSAEEQKPILDVLENMVQFSSKNTLSQEEESPLLQSMNQLYLKLELGKLLLLINRAVYHTYGVPDSISYQNHSQSVTKICQYIDTHYQTMLSTDSIARKFLMSKTQLYNIFKEVLRMSVSDYTAHVRITQAKSLLINSEYSIEIISQLVGYTNISSFSRVFKSRVGMGPLQYRKKHNS